jgi:hypothetical protein
MDTNTNWIKNLDAIDNCKQDIKTALKNKGVEMEGVVFAEYAEKIDALQLESGDTPTPTPSADYIYSNGYMENEDGTPCTTPDITTYVKYELPELNSGESYELELFGPMEFQGYAKGDGDSLFDYPDIVFGVDIPQNYTVDIKIWNGSKYEDFGVKEKYYHKDIIRDGVKYNSFVKGQNSGYFFDDNTVTDPSVKNKYKIIITK